MSVSSKLRLAFLIAVTAALMASFVVFLSQALEFFNTTSIQRKVMSSVTIVSAYFPLESKHSKEKYLQWIRNFLSLQDTLIIFTSHDMVDTLNTLRVHNREKMAVIPMELAESHIAKKFPISFWQRQFDHLDPERDTHRSYKLFWVWLSKSWFMTQAATLNPWNSDIFVWSDIGCFRNENYNGKLLIQHPEVIPDSAMLLMSIMPTLATQKSLWITKTTTLPYSHTGGMIVAGAQFAGHSKTIHTFHQAMLAAMDGYAERDMFLGDDQIVIQTLCLQNPSLCAFVPSDLVSGDIWFGLQHVFFQGTDTTRLMHFEKPPSLCQNADFHPRHFSSVWTMLTDGEGYVTGGVTLGLSVLRHSSKPLDLVVLELASKPLSTQAWQRLQSVGWQRCVVERIAPIDEQGTFGRFRDQFTKLRLWGMTEYGTVLYLDSDALVMRSIDDLLETDLGMDAIGVAADFGEGLWRLTFNMGVFLIRPNAAEYQRLLRLQKDESVDFDVTMAEQGFLNVVYKDQWYDIGFRNNANLAIYSQLRSYWDTHEQDICVIHYTMVKPWDCLTEYEQLCIMWRAASVIPSLV